MGMPRRPDQAFNPPVAVTPPSPSSGVFRGRLVIVFGAGYSGVFVYSPDPGKGNLVASITGAAGTDPYGNNYQAQISVYDPANTQAFIQLLGNIGGLQQAFSTGLATEAFHGRLFAEAVNPNTPGERSQITLLSPTSAPTGGDNVFVQTIDSPANDQGIATGILGYTDTSATVHELVLWGQGGVQRSSYAGLVGFIPLMLTDSFARTVTGTSLAQLTFPYAIPANDPNLLGFHQFPMYRVRAWGTATQATGTAVTLELAMFVFGLSQDLINTVVGTAGESFNWLVDAWVMTTSLGVSGTAIMGGLVSFADRSTGASVVNFPVAITSFTVDTTATWNADISAAWSSTAGSPTITCIGSVFAREGT